MSLETSVVPPVSLESCVRVELPKQPVLLGPAPFVFRDDADGLEGAASAHAAEYGLAPLPVPHRYSA